MKHFIIILLFATGCNRKQCPPCPDLSWAREECHQEISILTAQFESELADRDSTMSLQTAKVTRSTNRLIKVCDSIKMELNIANKRLVRIKNYVNICKANNSQKVFFFGWVDRALKE